MKTCGENGKFNANQKIAAGMCCVLDCADRMIIESGSEHLVNHIGSVGFTQCQRYLCPCDTDGLTGIVGVGSTMIGLN